MLLTLKFTLIREYHDGILRPEEVITPISGYQNFNGVFENKRSMVYPVYQRNNILGDSGSNKNAQ